MTPVLDTHEAPPTGANEHTWKNSTKEDEGALSLRSLNCLNATCNSSRIDSAEFRQTETVHHLSERSRFEPGVAELVRHPDVRRELFHDYLGIYFATSRSGTQMALQ